MANRPMKKCSTSLDIKKIPMTYSLEAEDYKEVAGKHRTIQKRS